MFDFLKRKKIEKEKTESVITFNELWNTNITDIWKIDDKNALVVAMNGWICKKCNYGESIEKLSAQERIFYIVQQLEQEVNNGGFDQYFFNSSGDFSNELFESFNAIGAKRTANICKKAIDSFGTEIPANKAEREEFFDKKIDDKIIAVFEECDNEFYDYTDNLEELNYQFIIKNKIDFS